MTQRIQAEGTCSHHRQNWEHGLLPCATPGCSQGRTSGLLVMRAGPKDAPATWALYDADLEEANIEEVAMRRCQPEGLSGAYAWRARR